MNLVAELDNTDRRTRALIEDLTDEQLAVPYEPGINPPIWELGHAAFFYEYFLLRELGAAGARMPGTDEIWDSFVIPHKHRWQEGVVPDRTRTLDYYTRILDEVRTRLAHDPSEHERYLCEYAITHHNLHIESLIWCRQTLGYPPPPSASQPPGASVPAGDAGIDAGLYPMGIAADGGAFAFDCEKPGFGVALDAFRIARTLVSNRDFLAFVEAGGYHDDGAWSFAGRCWRADKDRPHYWRRGDDGGWQTRRFDRWIDLPLDAPVLHVSYWEAEAYCQWAGRRLPTEPEWEAAARGAEGHMFPWGDTMDAARVDMDAGALGIASTGAYRDGASPAGCLQMVGTAWEWTSTPFLPYDGFKVDMYPFMSTLQFGDHRTTRGGSCATSSCVIRNTYRQAYFPGRRDAFTGFRTCAP